MRTKAQRKLRKVPHHSERLFALIRERDGKTEMCYTLARNAKEVWDTVMLLEMHGSAYTKESLREAGWVARPVLVEEK